MHFSPHKAPWQERGWGGALSQSTSDFVLGAWIDDVLEVESWALVGLFNAAADINALEQ